MGLREWDTLRSNIADAYVQWRLTGEITSASFSRRRPRPFRSYLCAEGHLQNARGVVFSHDKLTHCQVCQAELFPRVQGDWELVAWLDAAPANDPPLPRYEDGGSTTVYLEEDAPLRSSPGAGRRFGRSAGDTKETT